MQTTSGLSPRSDLPKGIISGNYFCLLESGFPTCCHRGRHCTELLARFQNQAAILTRKPASERPIRPVLSLKSAAAGVYASRCAATTVVCLKWSCSSPRSPDTEMPIVRNRFSCYALDFTLIKQYIEPMGASADHQTTKLWDRDAEDLLRCLLHLGSVSSAKRYIRDLMTEDEIRMIVSRWRVARLLAAGRTYRQIEEDTGLSSRTIARISHSLRNGEGGYRLLLRRHEKRKE